MGTVQRGDGSENHDATPAPDDEATPAPDDGAPAAEAEGDDAPVVGPVPEKIGEGGTNLRDRNAALSRRRGRDQPSP